MKNWPDGPMSEVDWPERLTAHVVTPGASPAIHGFRVADDLATNYSFAEVLILSLTGEIPEPETGRAFELALVFLAACGVERAPTHAARLARVCAAGAEKVVGIGAVALAEEARSRLAARKDVVGWLAGETAAFPSGARDPAATNAVASFREALPESFRNDGVFGESPSLDAAIIAVLWRCGVRTTHALITTLTVAALTCVSAEAFAETPAGIRGYPARLPEFSYAEDDG